MSVPNSDEETFDLLKEASAAKRQTYSELRVGAMRILDGLIQESHREDDALDDLRASWEARGEKVDGQGERVDAQQETTSRCPETLACVFEKIWEALKDAEQKAVSRHIDLVESSRREFQRELDALDKFDEAVYRRRSLLSELYDSTMEDFDFMCRSSCPKADVYQESLMNILSDLADLTWEKSDDIKHRYNQRVSQLEEYYEEQRRTQTVLRDIVLRAVDDLKVQVDLKDGIWHYIKVGEDKDNDTNEVGEDDSDDDDESDVDRKGAYDRLCHETDHKNSYQGVYRDKEADQEEDKDKNEEEDKDENEEEDKDENEEEEEHKDDDIKKGVKGQAPIIRLINVPFKSYAAEHKRGTVKPTHGVKHDYYAYPEDDGDYAYGCDFCDNWYDERPESNRKETKLYRRGLRLLEGSAKFEEHDPGDVRYKRPATRPKAS